jgi:methylthioribose-1-phosphate isomerase
MTHDQTVQTVRWLGDAVGGFLRLIDQTRLPTDDVELDCRDVPAVWEAIRSLRVRGAPAIGVAAAYGAVLGARSRGWDDVAAVRGALRAATGYLRTSRPTAVNLFRALDRMDAAASEAHRDGRSALERLLAEAQRIDAEDRAMCRAIGRHGAGS